MVRATISALVLAALSGCALYPSQIDAVPTETNFGAMDCKKLGAESQRLASTYAEMRGSKLPNTRNRYAHLNGEAYAVNDAIRVNKCDLPAVQIPSRLQHHKYPDSPE